MSYILIMNHSAMVSAQLFKLYKKGFRYMIYSRLSH